MRSLEDTKTETPKTEGYKIFDRFTTPKKTSPVNAVDFSIKSKLREKFYGGGGGLQGPKFVVRSKKSCNLLMTILPLK